MPSPFESLITERATGQTFIPSWVNQIRTALTTCFPSLGGTVSVATKTTTYTALSSDDVILCNATSAAFTVSLPTAVGLTGKQYVIKKTDSTFNAVTIDPNSTETIGGSSTTTLNTQGESLRFVSDGANWQIIDRTIPAGTVSVTMAANGFTGGSTTVTAFMQRNGDRARFIGDALFSTIFTGGSATFDLPTGLTINTAKIPGTPVANKTPPLGFASCFDVGVDSFVARVFYANTSRVIITAFTDDSGAGSSAATDSGGGVNTTFPFTWANNDRMFFDFDVPITGWNS